MDQLFSELSTALFNVQSRALGEATGLYVLAAVALLMTAVAGVFWLCRFDRVWTAHHGHGVF